MNTPASRANIAAGGFLSATDRLLMGEHVLEYGDEWLARPQGTTTTFRLNDSLDFVSTHMHQQPEAVTEYAVGNANAGATVSAQPVSRPDVGGGISPLPTTLQWTWYAATGMRFEESMLGFFAIAVILLGLWLLVKETTGTSPLGWAKEGVEAYATGGAA